MVFPLKFAYNPAAEMATLNGSDFSNFRFFATARSTSDSEQFDLAEDGACDAEPCNRWLTVDGATAVQPGVVPQKHAAGLPNTFLANFSAMCFLTVRDIARMHSVTHRPAALIQSAWGGTRVEVKFVFDPAFWGLEVLI